MSLEQMYMNRRAAFINRSVESLSKINALPEKIASDGASQLVVARQDESKLTEEGMDPALIVDVEETLGAFMWVSSLCDTKIADKRSGGVRYVNLKKQTYELRRLLVRFGKFGSKKNNQPEALVEIMEIIEGSGDEDLIYDMLKLYQLFMNNPTLVEGLLQFESNWIDQALAFHTELSELRAEIKNPDADSEIAQLEREVKQAHDLYNEKLNELRDWGQFVFDGEPRENEYRSEYMQARNRKAVATKKAQRELESETEM